MTRSIPILLATALLTSTALTAVHAQDATSEPKALDNGSTGTTQSEPMGSPESTPMDKQTDGAAAPDMAPQALNAEDLKGADIYDQSGDKVAEVKEVVTEPNGNAERVVVTVGGIFGLGGDDVQVPVNEIRVDQKGRLVVAMTEEQLKQFPPDVPKTE